MKEQFKDFGEAMVRSPLYSCAVLFNKEGGTKDPGELIGRFLDDPIFLEGVYWSSPQLYELVLRLKENKLKEKKKRNLLHTLKKYIIRAATRPTPYGIFAGSDITFIDDPKNGQEERIERKVSVDRALLQGIRASLDTDSAIYPYLLYSVNNTLYSIPWQYRFTETKMENGKYRYQLSSVDHTPFLQKVISVARHNKFSAGDLFELTGADTSFEVFMVFFKELVQSQFILSELTAGPTICNQLSLFTGALERLKSLGIGETQKYLDLLSSLGSAAQSFSELPVGILPLEKIEKIKKRLSECKISTCNDHLFHANLVRSPGPHFIVTSENVSEIKKGISVLGKLSVMQEQPAEIKSFKKLFREKYGDREVPLMEALDPEFGIGFSAGEMIGNTGFNAMIEKIKSAAPKANEGQNLLSDKMARLHVPPLNAEIRFEDEDLQDLENKYGSLPPFFSVMGSFLPSGRILLESAGGAHSNSLLGRFASLSPGIGDLIKKVTETEQSSNNEVIFAEIVFEPGGRVANVTCRPSFFEYEIPILAAAAVAEDNQVLADDLYVSVSGNRIVLRSRRLNKRVIPRLSNTHNYNLSTLPVYRFLSALQSQDEAGFAIRWQNIGFDTRFLPRVTYKNVILNRACWLLNQIDITSVNEAVDPVEQLRSFLRKWNVPRFVCLAEGDKELFMDTENRGYLEILYQEIRFNRRGKLLEWVYGLPFAGGENSDQGIHQFILPLTKTEVKVLNPVSRSENLNVLKNRFEPGSEWLYFKIYCGSSYSDQILANVVRPATDFLLKSKIIQKAFFIRYTDPHYHIRFRLHLTDDLDTSHFWVALKAVNDRMHQFSESGIAWNLQLDTYRRETEKYGNEEIIAAEWAFFYDSLLYLDCLEHEVFSGSDETRFLAAVKNIYSWLVLFRLTLKEKAKYCHQICESFSVEFGPVVQFRIDQKYRELSETAIAFLDSLAFNHEFRQRDEKLEKLILSKENLSSYIHMSINRWFLTDQRLLEFMCYLFCSKYFNQLLHYNPER